MHKYVIEDAILAKAFPIADHSRSYTESWIDEIEYPDIPDVSSHQKAYLYNAGVMMNGRIYSVDVISKYEKPIVLGEILEQSLVDERYFLREKDMPQWRYAKGAKNEQRKRRDGSTYWFSEGSVQFPEPLDKPSSLIKPS